MKSLSHLWFLTNVLWLSHWAMRWGVRIYTYPGGTPSIANHALTPLAPGGEDGIPGGGEAASGWGSPDSECLQSVSGICAVPFCQGRARSIWFLLTIARLLSITAFTWLHPANSTPQLFSAWTLVFQSLGLSPRTSLKVFRRPSVDSSSTLAVFSSLSWSFSSKISSCGHTEVLQMRIGVI